MVSKNVVETVDTVYCRKSEQTEESAMKSLFKELGGTYRQERLFFPKSHCARKCFYWYLRPAQEAISERTQENSLQRLATQREAGQPPIRSRCSSRRHAFSVGQADDGAGGHYETA